MGNKSLGIDSNVNFIFIISQKVFRFLELRILSVLFLHGSVHDFKCSAEVIWIFQKKKLLITDKEYIDINKIHSNNLD